MIQDVKRYLLKSQLETCRDVRFPIRQLGARLARGPNVCAYSSEKIWPILGEPPSQAISTPSLA